MTEEVLGKSTFEKIQRGLIKHDEFFGDMSISQDFGNFLNAAQSALNFSGFGSSLPNDQSQEFSVDDNAKIEISKKAQSIASYGNIAKDIAEEFLYILVAVDDIEDMIKIQLALEIEGLDNPDILRKPLEILALPELEKVAYLADAVAAIIKAFKKFTQATQNSDNNLEKVLGLASNVMGMATQFIDVADAVAKPGQLMLEKTLGKRIPTAILANNPMLQDPSYIGKRMFGESPTNLIATDMNLIFPKKIGVYGKPANGVGTSSFGMQNFASLGKINNIEGLVKNTLGNVAGNTLTNALDKVSTLTGASILEKIDLTKADNAVPLMMGMSALTAGLDKCPFDPKKIQDGWVLARGVTNFLQHENGEFLKALREVS